MSSRHFCFRLGKPINWDKNNGTLLSTQVWIMAQDFTMPASIQQTAFSIVTTVSPDAVSSLKAYLDEVGTHIKDTKEITFGAYDSLHFCSIQVIDDPRGADAPLLVFEGNIDGSTRSFLTLLAERNLAFLQRVYAACIGYPANATAAQLIEYILANDLGATAFYVGQPGATRTQIERDYQLRVRLEGEIDRRSVEFAGMTLEQCRSQLAEYVQSQPDLAWVKQPVPTLVHVRFGKFIFGLIAACVLAVPIGLVVLTSWPNFEWHERLVPAIALVLMVVIFAAYLAWLRYRENHDHQDDTLPLPDFVAQLQAREDLQLQNHLVSVTDVKPGWLRLLTLRLVLFAINLFARYMATQGDLGGIVTIHFARWVVLTPRGASRPRLLFLSNYDGTWENYLGEFIDRASVGLTAVWSNTQLAIDHGFPNTQWLVLGGSRDEQRFKNYARQSQQTGGIWYSAYASLSMKHITNNREIRLGLLDPTTDAAEWMRRF
jgi:hypothetical protein